MKKILILANNDIGLYKFRKELIEELLEEYEVHISLPYGPFVDELVTLGCRFIDTEISRRGTNLITDLKLMYSYKNILEDVKPDVVLTYTIKPNVYGGMMCRLLKIPYLPNVTGFGTAVENGGVLQKITIFLYRMGMKDANCIFFQNKENAQFAKKNGMVSGKYEILPGSGVNIDYYQPMEYPKDNEINFLFISRIMKQKGIDQYLEAAEYIKNKYPKTNFHILGFCEEEYQGILEEYQEKGIIKYHGMQDDVREFHKISHCTIHPTYYPEGMSNVLLETAACARPIITTNRSGCREIVVNGESGFLTEERNGIDLIEKIESFLTLNKCQMKEMGKKSREKVEKDFDRKNVLIAYKNMIYRSINNV